MLAAGSSCETSDETERIANLGNLLEEMKKLKLLNEMRVQTTVAVETASTLVKLVSGAECVKEPAEFVTDASKCVVGMRTIHQLVVISTRIVSMYAEDSRGRRVLPLALCRILILVRYVLRSLAEIMNPSSIAELIHEDFVFDRLQKAVDTMDTIETQFLSEKLSKSERTNLYCALNTTVQLVLVIFQFINLQLLLNVTGCHLPDI